MKIFITGGSGFIGNVLVKLLKESGHQILILTTKSSNTDNTSYIKGSIHQVSTYESMVREFRPDCSIHLAWDSLADYSYENCYQNFLATIKLFKILRDIDCKRVFAAGTCWEYGSLSGSVMEEQVGVNLGLFASFKRIIRDVGSNSFQNFIWGIPFFVYGPKQRSTSLIPMCHASMRYKTNLIIKTPTASNDFIHVQDLARALKILVETPNISGDFNLGSGRATRISRIINIAAKYFDLPPVYSDGTFTDASSGITANINKISSLGWQPLISIEEGVESTLEHLEEQN